MYCVLVQITPTPYHSVKGKTTRGRKRIQLLDDLADGKDYASLNREEEDRSMPRVKK